MIQKHLRWAHLPLALAIVLSMLIVTVIPVQAQSPQPNDTIPAGQIAEGDKLLFGQNIVMDGTVTGDLFAFGNTININGDVNGSLYMIGETVSINGEIGGSIYQAAVESEFGPSSSIGRNAYILGLRLATQPNAQIENNLTTICIQAWLSGSVGGNLKAIIGILNVDGIIGAGMEEEQLPNESAPGEQPPVEQDSDKDESNLDSVMALIRFSSSDAGLHAQTGARTLLRTAIPLGHRTLNRSARAADQQPPALEWFTDFIRKLATLMVFGFLAEWLMPKRLNLFVQAVRNAPLQAAGCGLVALVVSIIIGIVLPGLLLALGFFFWKITMWGLASIIISVGFAGLGLAALLFFVFIIYGSKIIVARLAGELILERLTPGIATQKVWPLLLGLVLYLLLRSTPTVGWVVGLIVTLLGLGAIWLFYRTTQNKTAPAAA